MLRQWIFSLILSLLFATAWAASSNVYHYTLKNGLQVYVKPNHRSPMVVNEVWYKVGSSDEPSGLTGISHALEHMMFEGTPKYPDGQFNAIISAHGGKINAFTTKDFTAYHEILPAKYLSIALSLEADRMQHLIINQKRFSKEIQVVKEERRMRTENNPQAYANERFDAAAYIASPYHHPVVGWMGDLNRMTAADLKRYYKKWYMPNNAVIVVAGDVDPKNVLRVVKENFAGIRNQPAVRIIPSASAKPFGKRMINVSLPAKLPFLLMGYNVPVVKTANIAWQPYALIVLSGILDGGDSSRLQKTMIRGQKIAAWVGINYNWTGRLDSLFVLTGVPSQKHTIKQLKKAFVAQIKLLAAKPVTADELERVKIQMIAQHVFNQDSLFHQATAIGSLVSVGLPWQLSDDYVQKVKAVTAKQVQAVAKQYLIKKRLTVAVLHPLPMSVEDTAKQSQAGAGYDKALR